MDYADHLTGANRSAGRRSTARRPGQRAVPVASALKPACRGCGLVLDDLNRVYCDDCLPDQRRDSATVFASAGPDVLGKLRAQGKDPAHGGEAGRRRGRRNAGHARANAEWERSNGDSAPNIDFARDVLLGLQGALLSAIAAATGLSLRYCSAIRRGLQVPHPPHWDTLRNLANEPRPVDAVLNRPRTSPVGGADRSDG